MATDRRSDHVGNHGGTYTDMDGMSKQFTYIDYDNKTQISFAPTGEDTEFNPSEYRAGLIKRITDVSASLCPDIFTDYTVRGEGRSIIEWNTDMLLDNGVPVNQLRDLCTLLENKLEMSKFTR